uniref:Putative ovule protein n=1 Tax=Solanum chacoense TaxID=4108 RepID=A0A0V0H7Z3_SOLCH
MYHVVSFLRCVNICCYTCFVYLLFCSLFLPYFPAPIAFLCSGGSIRNNILPRKGRRKVIVHSNLFIPCHLPTTTCINYQVTLHQG